MALALGPIYTVLSMALLLNLSINGLIVYVIDVKEFLTIEKVDLSIRFLIVHNEGKRGRVLPLVSLQNGNNSLELRFDIDSNDFLLPGVVPDREYLFRRCYYSNSLIIVASSQRLHKQDFTLLNNPSI